MVYTRGEQSSRRGSAAGEVRVFIIDSITTLYTSSGVYRESRTEKRPILSVEEDYLGTCSYSKGEEDAPIVTPGWGREVPRLYRVYPPASLNSPHSAINAADRDCLLEMLATHRRSFSDLRHELLALGWKHKILSRRPERVDLDKMPSKARRPGEAPVNHIP